MFKNVIKPKLKQEYEKIKSLPKWMPKFVNTIDIYFNSVVPGNSHGRLVLSIDVVGTKGIVRKNAKINYTYVTTLRYRFL